MLEFIGASAAGAVLAACQPKTVVVKETVEVEKEVEKVVKETVVVEKEVEKVVTATPVPIEEATVRWWWGWGSESAMKTFPELAAKFQEIHPNITIEGDTYGWEQEKILAVLAGGDPPDLFNTAVGWSDYAASNAIRPLEEYINGTPGMDQLFYPASWAMTEWEGQRWGVMGLEHFVVLGQMANVDIWEERGFTLPDDLPETWVDAVEIAKEYTEFDDAGNVSLLWAGISYSNWYQWAMSLGFVGYDSKTVTYQFDDPGWVEVFEVIADYYRWLGPDKLTAFQEQLVGNAMATGIQAWQARCGYWEPGAKTLQAPDKTFAYWWHPMSEARRGVQAQQFGGHRLMITTDAQSPAGAWELIKFLSSNVALSMIFDGLGWVVATTEFLDNARSLVDVDKYPGLDWFIDSVAVADAAGELWWEPSGPLDGFLFDKMNEASEAVMYGDQEPKEAAAWLNDQCQTELKRKGLA
jgi:ABC-type glycerol-3-phosphate transport system substrate-binding protein